MDYALVVRGGEPVAHLNAEPHDFAFGKRAGGQLFIQRNTRNQFHGEKIEAILAAEGIDRLDIRMIQLSQSQCFLTKLLSGLVVRQEPGRKHFERDFAVEVLVQSAVNHAHSTGAQLAKDQVVLYFLTDQVPGPEPNGMVRVQRSQRSEAAAETNQERADLETGQRVLFFVSVIIAGSTAAVFALCAAADALRLRTRRSPCMSLRDFSSWLRWKCRRWRWAGRFIRSRIGRLIWATSDGHGFFRGFCFSWFWGP